VCMVDGKCSKGFPKDFQSVTVINEKEGRALYRRRSPQDGGLTIQLEGGQLIDNRWVVPYNPYLLARFNCHINVEICTSIKGVKYLYKYIYKGGDRAMVREDQENIDEIAEYQDMRSFGSSEAAWKIYGFKMSHITPSIYRLAVHLPGDQSVSFDANQPGALEGAVAQGPPETSLTAWFSYNRTRDFENDSILHTYLAFPEYYVYEKKLWRRRVRTLKNTTIGRMYTISPRQVCCITHAL
jgi:hypothetical protein